MPATQLHCHAPVLARARGFLGQTPIKCSPLLSFSRGSLASGPHAQPSPAGNCSVSSNNFCFCSRMHQAIVSVLWNDKQQITARERFALSLNCTFMKFLFDNLHDYMGTYLHREYWSIGPWYRCACTHMYTYTYKLGFSNTHIHYSSICFNSSVEISPSICGRAKKNF